MASATDTSKTQLPDGEGLGQRYEQVFGIFSVKYVLSIIFRRKRFLVLPTVVVAALAGGGSFLIPKSYKSGTTILVQDEGLLNPLVKWEAAVSLTISDRLKTFTKIIYSRTLLEEVANNLELAGPDPSPIVMDGHVRKLRHAITTQQSGSDSFQIEASYHDPLIAKEIVETVTRLFIDKSLDGERKAASVAVNFIESQLGIYEKKLCESQEQLRSYKEANPKELPEQHAGYIADLESFESKLVEVEVTIKEKSLERELLSKRLSGEEPMVISQATYIQHTPYQTEYQRLTIQLQEMLHDKKPNHPDVIKIECDIDAIKKMLAEEKKNSEASERREIMSPTYQEILARMQQTNIELESTLLQKREYQRIVADLEQKVAKIPSSEMILNSLTREFELNRELVNTLKIKVEQARITQQVELQSQENRFQILDPARVPFRHYKPNQIMIIIAGLLGGFIFGFCLIFVFEFLDPAIVREEEVSHVFGDRVLARIPKLFV